MPFWERQLPVWDLVEAPEATTKGLESFSGSTAWPVPFLSSRFFVFHPHFLVHSGQNVFMYGFSSKYFSTYGYATLPGYAILTTAASNEAGSIVFNTPLTFYRGESHLDIHIFFSFMIDQGSNPYSDGMTAIVSSSFFLSLPTFSSAQSDFPPSSPALRQAILVLEEAWDMGAWATALQWSLTLM